MRMAIGMDSVPGINLKLSEEMCMLPVCLQGSGQMSRPLQQASPQKNG